MLSASLSEGERHLVRKLPDGTDCRGSPETFLLEEDVEFTIEANPGTLTMEKLETYRKLGVNRLSLGFSRQLMMN